MKNRWASLYPEKVTAELSPKKILEILLKNRQVEKGKVKNFLNPLSLNKILPSDVDIDKTALKKAVELIKKVGKDKKIVIYGDYDLDGLTATAILWEALWNRGYQVLPFVPSREMGYGLKKKAISELLKKHPDLEMIITVDNGIVAHQAVQYAKSKGLKVILTDHHLKESKIPAADAVIHTTEVAGCGVAWFLAREFGYQSASLTALGTIGDLLPLKGVNRSFVKFGLEELSSSQRKGIRALKRAVGMELNQKISPWQVSFILGPRLNAAGRISDPMDSLRLLCTNKRERARLLAENLDGVNKQRQEMMDFGVELAKEIAVEEEGLILAASSDFHPGIIGLIAGKLTEEFGRPAIVLSQGEEVCKGSARSVQGVDIVNLIRQTEDILIDVGGHPMAAGFSVKTENLENLFSKLQRISTQTIKSSDLVAEKEIDFEIDFSMIKKSFYRLIEKLAPFGVGNPRPKFILRGARVMNKQTVGSNNGHLKLWLDDPETPKIERIAAEAIGFGWGAWDERLLQGDLINLVFSFNLNRWNGKETLQLKIKDLEVC